MSSNLADLMAPSNVSQRVEKVEQEFAESRSSLEQELAESRSSTKQVESST